MSRIYFHSPSGESAISGRCRYLFGNIINNTFIAHFEFPGCTTKRVDAWICDLVPKDHYLQKSIEDSWGHNEHGFMNFGRELTLARDIKIWLSTGMDDRLIWKDKELSIFTTKLNTALAIGGDALKLAARIHGQCEIHCWVAGKNRKWLANIARKAIETGVFRTNEGWEKPLSYGHNDTPVYEQGVIDFLESNDEEPVVLSYSVCESFPGLHMVPSHYKIPGLSEDASYEEQEEAWYELSQQEQWDAAFSGVNPTSELSPDNWESYYFGDGTSVFDIRRQIADEALTRWKKEEREKRAKCKQQRLEKEQQEAKSKGLL